MRSIVRLLAAVVLFAAAMSSASAAVWYVSGAGTNSGPGTTPSNAFRQPSQVASLVVAGDTVFLSNGDYDPFTVTVSGTVSEPITWKAAAGASPRVIFSNAAIATLASTRSPTGNAGSQAALTVRASYQVFDGINFTGPNDLITSDYYAAARADALAIFTADYSRGNTTPASGLLPLTPLEAFNIRGIVLDNTLVTPSVAARAATTTPVAAAAPFFPALVGAFTKADNLKWHGLTVKNSIIQKFPDTGIAVTQSDYFVFESNRVYQNGWYGSQLGNPGNGPQGVGAGAAGIMFSAYNANFAPGTHNFIRRNKIWANEAKFQRRGCFVTTGATDSRLHVVRPNTPRAAICGGTGISLEAYGSNSSVNKHYTGRTLIANNLIVANGGSAIRTGPAFGTINGYVANIDVINNTVFRNQTPNNTDPVNRPGAPDPYLIYSGEVVFDWIGGTVRLANNIIWTGLNSLGAPARPTRIGSNGASIVGLDYKPTFANTLFWTDDTRFANCVAGNCSYISHMVSSATFGPDVYKFPNLVNPGIGNPDTSGSDFSLRADSPARNAGSLVTSYSIGPDLDGSIRPQGTITESIDPKTNAVVYAKVAADQIFDIGSYEYVEAPRIKLNQRADDGVVGNDYQSSIVSLNGGKYFSATGLPPGLRVNPTTGVVTGVPTVAGRFVADATVGSDVRIADGSVVRSDNKNSVVFVVTTDVPFYKGTVGKPVSFCTGYCNKDPDPNNPTLGYSAVGLPWNGIDINPSTGEISGTPQAPNASPKRIVVAGRGVTTVDFVIGALPAGWDIDPSAIDKDNNPKAIFEGVYGVSTTSADVNAFPDQWVLSGKTNRVANAADSFVSSWKTVSGNVIITAKVDSYSSDLSKSAAGVMIRQSKDIDSIHAATLVSPLKGVTYVRRLLQGDVTRSTRGYVPTPLSSTWVRVQRDGDLITSFYSDDGVKWNVIRKEKIAFSGSVQVGLVVASSDVDRSNLANFSNVKIETP